MKKITEENEDFAFYIKMLPLKTHPAAYKKSKAIICERSLRLLDRAFNGKHIAEPTCETTEVDDTIELAERLGISGTPTVVLPDGGIIRGYKDAEELKRAIEEAGLYVEQKEREAMEARLAEEKKAEEGEAWDAAAGEDAGSGEQYLEDEASSGASGDEEGADDKAVPEEKKKKKRRWWF